MSEISKIFKQYETSLSESQKQYAKNMEAVASILHQIYKDYLSTFIESDFSSQFKDQVKRLSILETAGRFFDDLDKIPFVAIDGSCKKNPHQGFISFYGGAYGSRGSISFEGSTHGQIKYDRWEFKRDVSMVAFVPVPPNAIDLTVDSDKEQDFLIFTDNEIQEMSSLHTKVMQLAEIFLAYSVAESSSTDYPRIILLDNNLTGILGNTSFSPRQLKIRNGVFRGRTLTEVDCQIALAHPFNKELDVPTRKAFLPHYRIIAEAAWREKLTITKHDCGEFAYFKQGAIALQGLGAGEFDEHSESFKFNTDPLGSWKKTIDIFKDVCDKLFRDKASDGLMYRLNDGNGRKKYMTYRDVQFFTGVGIRALIETCWRKRILLIGIAKDSSSRYFFRNWVGSYLSLSTRLRKHLARHRKIYLTDRQILEMLPYIIDDISAPWGTKEFDSCFVTLHPELKESRSSVDHSNGEQSNDEQWIISGYHTARGPITRPERIFLRSISQFLLNKDDGIASHALFVDRLVYPKYDSSDSLDCTLEIKTDRFGTMNPFCFQQSSPLYDLIMYFLGILIRNHYPEALGYPDPLHQADWGAKSMERQIARMLDSSDWSFRANPLSKTFRQIRDKFRR
ncbi:MAG: hypothetical protein ACXADA_08525 [Candidatus Hodarchaeales archaeon]|jgi:hypothetical protein